VTIHEVTNTRHGIPHGDGEVSITYRCRMAICPDTGTIDRVGLLVLSVAYDDGRPLSVPDSAQAYWCWVLEDGFDAVVAAAARLVE
jgi:hypothetical protein